MNDHDLQKFKRCRLGGELLLVFVVCRKTFRMVMVLSIAILPIQYYSLVPASDDIYRAFELLCDEKRKQQFSVLEIKINQINIRIDNKYIWLKLSYAHD